MLKKNAHLTPLLSSLAFALLFGSTSVHAQTTTERATGAPPAGSADKAGSTQSMAGGKLPKKDGNMLRDIAYANLAEIEAGKLAQSKSKDEKVKAFAQQMIDDHTKAMGEVQQLAQSKGATLPTEPDAKHMALMKKMEALSESKFDQQYMAQGGVKDHRQTHDLLRRVQRSATDPELKALAAKMQPVVDQHLKTAQESQAAMKSASTSVKSDKSGAPATSGASGTSGTSGTQGGK